MIDVTHRLSPRVQTFPAPWHVPVEFDRLAELSEQGRRASRIVIGSHTGTHVDAPSHFIESGATIDQFPLDLTLGTAQVVDLRSFTSVREVTLPRFLECMGGRLPAARMLLVFGWSDRFGTSSFYTESPFVSEEVAAFLADGGVRLLAYDTASLDNPKHGLGCRIDSPIHRILLGEGVWLAEYVNVPTNIVLPQSVSLMVAPLPLEKVDGSPARCILLP